MRPGANKRIAVSGTIVAFLLVAGLGNQWVFKEAWKESSDHDKWYTTLLRIVSYPLWIVDRDDLGDDFGFAFTTRYVTAGFVGFALLLVAVAAVLALGARGLGERSGGFAAFVVGWFSLVFGGAVNGLTVVAIANDDEVTISEGSGFDRVMANAQAGAYFGVLLGWLVGLAAVAVYRSAVSHGPPASPLSPGGYGPPFGYGAPPASGHPGYGAPSPYDAPTTIRPAGPPPTAPPRPTGAPDTPPGGYRP
ncbi:hypothetical protein B4N89_20000 [Embleya scabrispora]|uniref:Uncharacterized protein n=1 Tax=Embleya scabrispora TaxID=159449 RepID=A0A1T3P1C9_9ACTN|nr:hypothetical protein [Embleya scabrispora]OPC82916.1 hypothetical protein B4N89_20000 [Embleya scabrispora]